MHASEKLKNSKCVLLDLDGTVLYSYPVWRDAPFLLLEREHITLSEADFARYAALDWNARINMLLDMGLMQGTFSDVENRLFTIVDEGYHTDVVPMEGAVAFLRMLKAAGKRIVAVTDNIASPIRAALEKNALLPYFDALYCCPEYGMSKREEAMFSLVLEQEGVCAGDCIFFDDSGTPLATAKRIGIYTVAVDDGTERDDAPLRDASAMAKTKNYSEFLEITPMTAPEKLKTCKGILLDLDGTILNSMPIWRGAPEVLLARYGVTPNEAQREKFSYLRFKDAVSLILDEGLLDLPRERVQDEMYAIIFDGYHTTVEPKAGAVEFLKHLKASGKRVIAVTDNDPEPIDAGLKRCDLGQYFDAVYCCPAYGMTKRKREIFDFVLEREGLAPNECMLFDDAPWPHQTAKPLGIYCVAVFDPSARMEREAIDAAADAHTVDYFEFL